MFLAVVKSQLRVADFLDPFALAIFCCDFRGDFKRDFAAISNRPCKLLVIQIATESPVVYREIAATNRRCKRAFTLL